jgi:hypothetical protein
MAEKVHTTFSLMYNILKYGYYLDEAICVMKELNYDTLVMWSEYLRELIDFMDKRVVTIDHRDQKYLRNPRIAYFQVRFIMNKNFDIKDLIFFVSYFDRFIERDDTDDEDEFEREFKNKLRLKKKKSRKRKRYLPVKNKYIMHKLDKYINVFEIKQDRESPISIKTFEDLLSNHTPDLIHSAYDKIEIANLAQNKTQNQRRRYNYYTLNDLISNKINKKLGNDQANPFYIDMIDVAFINVRTIQVDTFLEKCESKIISLALFTGLGYYLDIMSINNNNQQLQLTDQSACNLRGNEMFEDALQFLFIGMNCTKEFINTLFLNEDLPKLQYLKEIIVYANSKDELLDYFSLFSEEYVDGFKSNFRRLQRFGINFTTLSTTSYQREYNPDGEDWVQVSVKDYFYIHIKEKSEVTSFKVYLNGYSQINGEYLHSKYDPEKLCVYFVKFITFDAEIIEEIEDVSNFISEEESDSLQRNFIGVIRLPQYVRQVSDADFWRQIQVEIPCENVNLIDIKRRMYMRLDDTIEVSKDIKQINENCEINLSISWENLCYNISLQSCIEQLEEDIFTHIEISNIKNISKCQSFICELLKTNPNLKSLAYSHKLSATQRKKIDKYLKKMPKCTIKTYPEPIHDHIYIL